MTITRGAAAEEFFAELSHDLLDLTGIIER